VYKNKYCRFFYLLLVCKVTLVVSTVCLHWLHSSYLTERSRSKRRSSIWSKSGKTYPLTKFIKPVSYYLSYFLDFCYATLAYIRQFIFAGCYDNDPWYLVTNLAGHLDLAGYLDFAGFYFSKCPAKFVPRYQIQDRIFIL
jgi:hypothetical protein